MCTWSAVIPRAGGSVCGRRRPLLAVPLGRVVHSVAGQQGEDEVRRLAAEIRLTFHLALFLELAQLLVVHAYSQKKDNPR